MSAKRARRSAPEPLADASVTEKHVDATDEEQSSDDEAPEEVSAAAATALAGRRRKAEQQARQAAAAPKRKRARSSKGGKNASDADADADAVAGTGGAGSGLVGGGELELPSDLLLKVKSGGLQRMEADVLAAKEMKEQAEAASATALSAGRRVRKRAGDLPRSDNFQLVVLDEEDGGVGDGAGSKPVAAENARKFLRDRLGSRKRVSYSLLKARKRVGPSPNF